MSHIFYDHLISLDEIEKKINESASSQEEKEELWALVDEIVHHRVLGCILDNLPRHSHEEFLSKFHEAPHDEFLIEYLKGKIGKNVEEIIKQEIGNLAYELIGEIRSRTDK